MSTGLICPKCGGKMRKGELSVITTSSQLDNTTMLNQQMMSMRDGNFSPLGLPLPVGEIDVEGPVWREESETERGWIFNRKGKKDLQIHGIRCLDCGFIELFVKLK